MYKNENLKSAAMPRQFDIRYHTLFFDEDEYRHTSRYLLEMLYP